MKPIDLGTSYDEMMPATPSEVKEKHYPSWTYDGDEQLDFPHEGVMTIRYKKVRSSESEDRDGDEHYSCTFEVQEILDVQEEKDESPTKKYNDAEDALDELMAEKMKDKSESY